MTLTDMDEEVIHKSVYSTGVLERLVIRNNVLMRDPKLLAGILEASKPLKITFENCSRINLRWDGLRQIASHCPHLISLNLYRCGALLSECFESFADASSFWSPRAMEQFASGLDLSHMRVLTLHDLPSAATTPQACYLLEQLADHLSAQLLHLDLTGANFRWCSSFSWLSRLRHLRVLILTNCFLPINRSLLVDAICELHDLVRLDLHQLCDSLGENQNFNLPDYEFPVRHTIDNLVKFSSTRTSKSLDDNLILRVHIELLQHPRIVDI